MRDYAKNRRAREPLLRELIALGITYEEISELMGCCVATITHDVARLGGVTAFKNRPSSRGETYAAVIKQYAEIVGAEEFGKLAPASACLRDALAKWLNVDGIIAKMVGIFFVMEERSFPEFSPDRAAYERLMSDVSVRVLHRQFGMREHERNARGVWREILQKVACGEDCIPTSEEELFLQNVKPLAMRHREEIMPIWTDEAFALIGRALKSLTTREEQVIRLSYGIGVEKLRTLKEIGDEMGVTRERVRQILAKALRKLRHPARGLSILWKPIGNVVHETLERKRAEEEKKARLAESADVLRNMVPVASIPILVRPLEELDLSVRSFHCLRNAGVTDLFDLVQYTEQELLLTKNFGRKSLYEIKNLLSEHGLKLGLNFTAEDKAALKYKYRLGLRSETTPQATT